MKLASRYNILAVLLVLLALLANCTSALAADYEKVGVKVGNTADYETSLTSSDYNRTHILVYGIVGTIIYLNFTYYHPNGVVGSESQLVGDVFAGGGYLFAYFLAANLTAGDPIYSNAPEKINETITMTVAGTPRTVNHRSVITNNEYFDAYWDKPTGLMTKLNFWLLGWINMTIISTDAWSTTPPPPIAPPLSVKLSGEFDYSNKEDIDVRLAALVKDANTLLPVSGAHVIIEIYHPNGTLWISGNMLEKLVGTGIYEWESSNKINKMKLKEGVYLVHVKAFLGVDPTASDMLLFHIDPPLGSEDPQLTTMPYYAASATVLFVGTIVGIFLIRRHKKMQAETAQALKLTHTK
jgi:hypothetical protein